MKKYKVVWLCHFTNNFLNNYFCIEKKELSRWIDSFTNIVLGNDMFDIHIVAPNYWTHEDHIIERENITYHLYRYRHTKIARIGVFEQLFTKERYIKKKIKSIIDGINPDVIHLFGSENMDYSCGILNYAKNKNVIISIQGFVNLARDSQGFPRNLVLNYRKKLEEKINSTFNKITLGPISPYLNYVHEKYPNVTNIKKLAFPTTIPEYDSSVEKKYDIVFWGRICREKGFIDLLEAVYKLKQKGHNFNMLVIGKLENASKTEIFEKIAQYNLKDQIELAGFQKDIQTMFKRAQEGRIYVLPTHYDGMPGSVREAMHLRIPVITTPVGVLSRLNDEKQCVILTEPHNTDLLGDKILCLLHDKELYNQLSKNAVEYATKHFSNKEILTQLEDIYKELTN